MASEVVNNLCAFLELQMHGESYASFALHMGYDLLAEENSDHTFHQNTSALELGDQAAYNAIKRKVFPDANLDEVKNARNEWLDDLQPQLRGDVIPNTSALEELIKLAGNDQLEALAMKQRMSAEELRAKMLSDAASNIRNDELAALRKPSVHRFFLRRFALQLDEAVEELEKLEELSLEWEFVPPHLQILLSQAHEAALFGDVGPAAVLFGVALEEALKNILGRDQVKYLDDGIDKALESGLLEKRHPAYNSATKIRKWRNCAAHDPQKFLLERVQARDLLDHARFALVHLFSEKAK